jgi:hypothetical protein
MPLKINVGLSRKIGEDNYGSRGASINIEMELDGSLANDPTKLQGRIKQLFGLVRDSVTEELNGNGNGAPAGNGSNGTSRQPAAKENQPQRRGDVRSATQSQVKAIFAITRSQSLDMTRLLRERFHVDRPDDLTLKQASSLIDELKKAGNGKAG